MGTLSDPLTLLRDYTMAKTPITLEGDHIVFGSKLRFARGAAVARRLGDGGQCAAARAQPAGG